MMRVYLTLALVVSCPSLAVGSTHSVSLLGCLGIDPYTPFVLPNSTFLEQIEGKKFMSLYKDGTQEDSKLLTLTFSPQQGKYKYVDIQKNVIYGELEWKKTHFILRNLPKGVFGAHHGSAWLVPSYGNNNNLVLKTCRISWLICREDMMYYLTSNTEERYLSTRLCKTFPGFSDDGLIIAGGSNGSFLSDVETSNVPQLPDLPDAVAGLTLSIVGNKLFACGGSNSKYEKLNSCYKLDASNSSSNWTRVSTDIPVAMEYHTASVIGSDIWLVYRDKLYDFNTVNEKFQTHYLPFNVKSGMCAVSNDTHTYLTGVGSGKDEIWINTISSKPDKWDMVAKITKERYYHSCLWLDNSVYITGGRLYRADVEIFDISTNTVRMAGNLTKGLQWHRMIDLNGQAAVIGGRNKVINQTSDIETYNVATEQWATSTKKLKGIRSSFGLVQL